LDVVPYSPHHNVAVQRSLEWLYNIICRAREEHIQLWTLSENLVKYLIFQVSQQ